ncbi:trypsin-like serine protease, partial [Actinoplanes sp. NPDC051633]|uniref:DUF7910 domain-containing protein n=1 Tax=Actinoplanes sp. NPDC051633 TaxID=3155670 RepID=UPI00342449C6
VATTVTTRPDQASGAQTVAVDHLFVRDDRDLALVHLAGGLTGLRGDAPVSASAPADGETLRVLGFGRTAREWVPDLPHTAQFSVQDVSATGLGIAPTADGGICKGDAGGPVVRENSDGTANLVAVVSTSWQGGCLGESDARRDATATRIDGLADWINQFTEIELTGVVETGTESGCLVLTAGGVTYTLAGGDGAVVKAGATVHVSGYRAPSATSSCTQGVRFRVTQADTVATLVGTVTQGVEECLLLSSGGVTYHLMGGDRDVVTAGAKLTVTGFRTSGGSKCAQGTMFRVLSSVPAKQVSLRAHANNRYVTAENAGATALIANRTAVGPWELFDAFDLGNGNVALRAHANDMYVTAENAGAGALIANRTAVGLWETFQLVRNADGSISLKAQVNGRYVTAENAGAGSLIANRTAIGPWEQFDLIDS